MLLPEQDIPIASYCEYDLVKLAQEGSERAMEVLFERYQTRLSLYLARMVGNDGIGCELTQETFVKAWESLPRLRDPELFKSWLYRIATNVAYDHLRSTRRFRSFQWLPWNKSREEEYPQIFSLEGPERSVEEAELLKIALSRVSLAHRSCIVLQIVEGIPQREIAALLGIKESSVSQYVSRGLKELRQIYCSLTDEPLPQRRRDPQ